MLNECEGHPLSWNLQVKSTRTIRCFPGYERNLKFFSKATSKYAHIGFSLFEAGSVKCSQDWTDPKRLWHTQSPVAQSRTKKWHYIWDYDDIQWSWSLGALEPICSHSVSCQWTKFRGKTHMTVRVGSELECAKMAYAFVFIPCLLCRYSSH